MLLWLLAILLIPFGIILACRIGWSFPSVGFATAIALGFVAAQNVPSECPTYADFCMPLIDKIVFAVPLVAAIAIGGCALLGPWERRRNQWRERVVDLPRARLRSRTLAR